jgi:hypothetical protein
MTEQEFLISTHVEVFRRWAQRDAHPLADLHARGGVPALMSWYLGAYG